MTKRKPKRSRNIAALMMILHRKGGKHRDRKRESKSKPPSDEE